MEPELILCIPGSWKNRSDFVRSIVEGTNGEFMFAGMILACPSRKEHVQLDFTDADPHIKKAFEIAGRGKLSPNLFDQIGNHQGVAYVHFPLQFTRQKEKLATFTEVLRRCGGMAVKIESAGIAHDWEQWFSILSSKNPFDLYRSFVVLVGDMDQYFSCGMHHFGLPDAEVTRSLEINAAADLLNRFNYWQVVEEPKIASGQTFSITPDAPRYRLTLHNDARRKAGDLFHNPNGVWSLTRIEDAT